jgi:hypothetical protein
MFLDRSFKYQMTIIPGISGPLSIVISSICAVINLTFYYTFDLNLYREGLNFVDKQNNNNEYIKELNIQLTQIKICKELYMHFPTKLTSDEEKNKIAEHGERINLFTIKKYPSSKGHKAAKIFIYSFGALSTIGGEFFFIKSVLDYLFPMLLLSPGATLIAAYIIIPISILWALVEFKLTSGSGIDTFIYPEKVTYQKLETELSNFKKEYDEFYSQYNRPPLLELQPTGT